MASLVETIEQGVARTGSPAALSRALGLSPSQISRVRRGQTGIGAVASLLLSRVTGRPRLQGLREDGHGELADVLEAEGAFNERAPTAVQWAVLDALDSMDPADRDHFLGLITSLARRKRGRR